MISRRVQFSLVLASVSVCVRTVVVHTEYGALSGTLFNTSNGRTVHAFLGVPYAKPPVGENRFEEPLPPEKWNGIQPAQKYGSACIQLVYYSHTGSISGDEDCLYLNVFTPVASNISKLDVVVFIHGGAFMFGHGNRFTPKYLLDRHDLVYISISYRLGPFGFLSTEDGVIPGNNGLKDQVLALKWIQRNIENFGGDKNKVTITGWSAGGASVQLHYLSPLSRDLFHQGISVSGSAFCSWALTENSRLKAHSLASSVNCPTNDSQRLLECLRLRPAELILSQIEKLFMPWFFNPFSPFGPVVEYNSSAAFLPDNPYVLLSKGQVKDAPWLSSITTEEGLYPAASFIENKTLLKDLDENWNTIAPHLLDYNFTVREENLDRYSENIRQFYLGNKSISVESTKELVKMMSDRLFLVDIERSARMQASVTSSPVYFYSFSYRGKYSVSSVFCYCMDDFGVSHGDDLMYLLTLRSLSPLETDEDTAMSNMMVDIWMSFVRSGVPSPDPETIWLPVSQDIGEESFTYLHISSSKGNNLSVSKNFGNHRFWNDLYFAEPWYVNNKNSGVIRHGFDLYILVITINVLLLTY